MQELKFSHFIKLYHYNFEPEIKLFEKKYNVKVNRDSITTFYDEENQEILLQYWIHFNIFKSGLADITTLTITNEEKELIQSIAEYLESTVETTFGDVIAYEDAYTSYFKSLTPNCIIIALNSIFKFIQVNVNYNWSTLNDMCIQLYNNNLYDTLSIHSNLDDDVIDKTNDNPFFTTAWVTNNLDNLFNVTKQIIIDKLLDILNEYMLTQQHETSNEAILTWANDIFNEMYQHNLNSNELFNIIDKTYNNART